MWLKGVLRPPMPFTHIAVHQPEAPQRARQTQSGCRALTFPHTPGECGTDVVMFRLQPGRPYLSLGAERRLLSCLRQLDAPVQMPLSYRWAHTGCLKPL